MRLVAKSDNCTGGECPTVWQSEDGAFYIQGYTVNSLEMAGVHVPDGEAFVRIDVGLLNAIKGI